MNSYFETFAHAIIPGAVAALGVNAVMHPVCTAKNCRMALGEPLSQILRRSHLLYRGYWSVVLLDLATFPMLYAINKEETLFRGILGGLITTPIITVGESLMANRQVHLLPYRAILSRAFTVSGFMLTALREVPFSVAVFVIPPRIRPLFGKESEQTHVAAAATAGAIVGYITTPLDLIKTEVQTGQKSVRDIFRRPAHDFFRGALYRSICVSGATIVLDFTKRFFKE